MIPFIKMHGLGNDFAVIDNRKGSYPALNWGKIADRHLGVGCDQVVVLEKSASATVFMRIFNADGSEVESCGNASRCVAWLMRNEKPGVRTEKSVTIETLAGVIEAFVRDEHTITIDMGAPRLTWQEIPLAEEKDTLNLDVSNEMLKNPVAVNIGNPHIVFFVPDVDAVPLERLGPELEKMKLFPARVNVGIAHIESRERMRIRVWERGAGLTLACGTGACAALVAAHRRGLTGRKAQVKLPGGALHIQWREEDDHVLMTGPATLSFEGMLNESQFSPA